MKSVCILPQAEESAIRPLLMRLTSRAIFSLSLGSTEVGVLGALQPFVDLPDALNGPAEIRVALGDADYLIYVACGAFAYGVGRIRRNRNRNGSSVRCRLS